MTHKSLKLLHTSDLHLGSDIYPSDALLGFDQVIDMSLAHSVDGVIIAGDLFDNRGVSEDLVWDIFRRLGELQRPVIVLPGNHDTFLMNGSFNWYVGIAHGLVTDNDPYNEYSSKITPEELAEADCDYVALGHVHVFREVTSGHGVPAYYSGAPSGGKSPTVVIVSLHPEDGVCVEPIKLPR